MGLSDTQAHVWMSLWVSDLSCEVKLLNDFCVHGFTKNNITLIYFLFVLHLPNCYMSDKPHGHEEWKRCAFSGFEFDFSFELDSQFEFPVS